jgi:hypothetical protein
VVGRIRSSGPAWHRAGLEQSRPNVARSRRRGGANGLEDPKTSRAEDVLGGGGSHGPGGVPASRRTVAEDEEQASCIKRSGSELVLKMTEQGGSPWWPRRAEEIGGVDLGPKTMKRAGSISTIKATKGGRRGADLACIGRCDSGRSGPRRGWEGGAEQGRHDGAQAGQRRRLDRGSRLGLERGKHGC